MAPLQPRPGCADAVESELDRLSSDAPALVGNSLGGWVALELARRGRAARAVVISPSGLESPPERALVIALNEQMRLRARFGAPLGQWLTAPALARVMLFGGPRSQPWRLSPDAAARDLHDFGYSPGFQPTLRCSTIQSSSPEQSSTSPLTPIRHHDQRPRGHEACRPGAPGRRSHE